KFERERIADPLTQRHGVALVLEPTESQNFLLGSSREFVGYDHSININLHFEPVDNFILSTGVLLIYFILGLQISHNICFSLKMNTASPSPQSGPILNVFNWILSFQLVNTFQHF